MWAGKRAVKAQVESPDLQRRLPGQHLCFYPPLSADQAEKDCDGGTPRQLLFFYCQQCLRFIFAELGGQGWSYSQCQGSLLSSLSPPQWCHSSEQMFLRWAWNSVLAHVTWGKICQGLIGKLSAQEKQGEVSSLTLDIAPGGNEAGTGRIIWWPQEGPARGQSQCIDDELF